jgi:hypothetical protein
MFVKVIFLCKANLKYDFYVWFLVTLDLKAFFKLIAKKDDQNFELGGRGFDKEFCIFCSAVRVRNVNYIL